MKRLNEFLEEVLNDLGTWCDTSATQDYKTVLRRIEHEGLSFLTITLTDYGKDFEKSLDRGYVGPSDFASFERRRGLPLFLGGFLDQVFDRSTGLLLDSPSIVAIWSIRQFSLMFGKIRLPCSDAREAAAFDSYVKCEQEVRLSDAFLAENDSLRDDFKRVGRILWARTFSIVDGNIANFRLRPKHGPGSTADMLLGNKKWNQLEWTARLENVFSHVDFLSTWSLLDRLDNVTILEPGAERPVKVISVPKTLKTPRLIAKEPTCMQYAQQALKDDLVGTIESFSHSRDEFDNFISTLVGFSDQTVNNRMAQIGSLTGTLATLDLSEASDRVSNQHVRLLLENHPHLFEAVDASRSRKADVPGHGVIRLAKFASMGSALTFPMEAIVFATVVFLGIERELKRPLTREIISNFSGLVRIYGDDIIIPVDFVASVVETLELFGFKVNTSKSFWNGVFRESCGKEYYAGEDVSITRLRSSLPSQRGSTAEIVSLSETRNQLYKAGLWRTTKLVDNILEGLIPFPVVEETSPILGKVSFLPVVSVDCWDYDLHIPLVKGMKVISKLPVDELDDYGALMKCLLTRCGLPATDSEHLRRAGRPRVVHIKRGMAQPW